MIPCGRRDRNRCFSEWVSHSRVVFPAAFLTGVVTLTAFSALQKLFIGAPVMDPSGYVVPALFGGSVGLVVAAGYRQRERYIERLHEEIGVRDETELRLRRYRQAVESSTNLIAGLDDDLNILFANRSYRRFHGLDPDADLTDVTLPEILEAREFDAVEDYIDRALQGEACSFEVIRTRADGTERHFAVRNYPLEDDDGSSNGVVAAMNDVTERRDRRRELVAQKQRYESLFESIRDAIVVADTDGRIVDTNQAFEDLFGFDPDTVEGISTSVLYAEEIGFDAADATDETADVPSQPRTYRYEKRSGQVFTGEESLFVLRDTEGAVVGRVAIIRDVSGRETRLQYLQVLDRILRHNINNDMNVIAGYAETIRDLTGDPVSSYAGTILDRSEGLVEMAGKQRRVTAFLSSGPSTATHDFHDIVTETTAWARKRYPDAEITIDVPDSCVASATDDIGQALEELVENAVEHSSTSPHSQARGDAVEHSSTSPHSQARGDAVVHGDGDPPTVHIDVQRRGDSLEVSVGDEGPGIPEMERSILTGDADLGPLYHGSGLGLWLVNLIVRQSNGVLRFEEGDPHGSVVTMVLPLEE